MKQHIAVGIALVLSLFVGQSSADAGTVNPTFDGSFTISQGGDISPSTDFSYQPNNYYVPTTSVNCLFSSPSTCYDVPGNWYYSVSNDHITSSTVTINSGTGSSQTFQLTTTQLAELNSNADVSLSASFLYDQTGTFTTSAVINYTYSYTYTDTYCAESNGYPNNITCTQDGYNSYAESSSGSQTLLGSVLVTPLPAAIPLFATGLGALVLLGWRRKRAARCVFA